MQYKYGEKRTISNFFYKFVATKTIYLPSHAMNELKFIQKNIDKWERVEIMATDFDTESPDAIADAYMDITSDLAFAYTNFPSARITQYLNNLAAVLHNAIYVNKREKRSRLLTFWTREVPQTMYKERRQLLVSFVIFAVSVLIGIASQAADADFCRVILGDAYVERTLDNISAGTPMAVYDGGAESTMFLAITFNNIGVAFRIFAAGLVSSAISALMLMYNGIMLGCFETFFAQHQLLGESMLAVFLHGTLEISAIIIAGAGALAMGNSWLFPGTYSRLYALRRGARRGLKIIVGTVPLFIVAGFIEGYVTRHTELPDSLRLGFIIASLVFVVGYYVVMPYMRNRKS